MLLAFECVHDVLFVPVQAVQDEDALLLADQIVELQWCLQQTERLPELGCGVPQTTSEAGGGILPLAVVERVVPQREESRR